MESSVRDIIKVYQMLEDDESKDTYLKRLNYLISNDFQYIRDIATAYMPGIGPGRKRNLDAFLSLLPEDRNFVLYGAGVEGGGMLCFVENDPRFLGFCSGTKIKQEKGYLGYPVMRPEELLFRKDLSVIISTTAAQQEIMQILEEANYPRNLIFDGSAVYADILFDPEQYFGPSFMKYEDNEVLIDAGCFNLGSSLKFREHCPNLKKIYAFEPDPGNYKQCLIRKEQTDFPQANILPYGTWSERKTVHFVSGRNNGSHISAENGRGEEITVVPIDDVIGQEDKVTMIKMDVEGAELESLKGAKNIILRDKPKLAICIYHKPEDMTELPLYIKELVPEYKLYVRHHSNNSSETVLYAVMP